MIILDTDVLIEIMDRNSERGDDAFHRVTGSGDQFSTTSISLHEILYGCAKLSKPMTHILDFPALLFESRDAQLSSRIEAGLEAKGLMVRRMDAMIAAIVIRRAARLYTYNIKHFERMKEFGLELFAAE